MNNPTFPNLNLNLNLNLDLNLNLNLNLNLEPFQASVFDRLCDPTK